MHTEDGTLLRVLRSGARGYVLKGADRAEIVRAILTVAAGGTVFGGQMGARMAELVLGVDPERASPVFASLTPRENEVLTLVAEGVGNHEVARRLVLSEKTVRNHVATILTKLQVRDRAAAVARAHDAGVGPWVAGINR